MNFLDFAFPKFCLNCGVFGDYICDPCQKSALCTYPVHFCHVCRGESRKYFVHSDCQELTSLSGVFIPYVYNDLLSQFISEAKYSFHSDIFSSLAGILFSSVLLGGDLPQDIDLISYVPLSAYKHRWRGFNQAKILADCVGESLNAPVRGLIKRVVNAKSQVGRDRRSRLGGLHNSFGLMSMSVAGRSVLVVDDVMTTGATLEACAKVLLDGGANKVYGLTLGRGST